MDAAQLYSLYLKAGKQATTDSRNCPAGSIFFALTGESFDGNKFAKAALDNKHKEQEAEVEASASTETTETNTEETEETNDLM